MTDFQTQQEGWPFTILSYFMMGANRQADFTEKCLILLWAPG